jgi:tRNA/rRNA methyltransferase
LLQICKFALRKMGKFHFRPLRLKESINASVDCTGRPSQSRKRWRAARDENHGFSDLRIVDSDAHLEPAARWVAHGSGDILDNINTYPTLAEALHDVSLPSPPRPAAGRVSITTPRRRTGAAAGGESQWMNHAALVFGREDSG